MPMRQESEEQSFNLNTDQSHTDQATDPPNSDVKNTEEILIVVEKPAIVEKGEELSVEKPLANNKGEQNSLLEKSAQTSGEKIPPTCDKPAGKPLASNPDAANPTPVAAIPRCRRAFLPPAASLPSSVRKDPAASSENRED